MDSQTDHFFEHADTAEEANRHYNEQVAAEKKRGKGAEKRNTGDEPMTDEQRSYLQTLSQVNGETYDDNLTRAEADELIDAKKQNITVPPPYDVNGQFWNGSLEENRSPGDEPATEAQLSYLETLAKDAGEPAPTDKNITKTEASKRIEALQQQAGRQKNQQ